MGQGRDSGGWRARRFAGEIAATAAVAALLWLAIGVLLFQQREALLSQARHDTANLARAFEENTDHAIDAADQALLVMRSLYRSDPRKFSFLAWNESARSSDGLILQLAIVDRDGIVVDTNLDRVQGRLDISDREHFWVQREATGEKLFISGPVLGRASGRWSIQMTRRILDAGGAFDGVMVISLDPVVLSKAYAAVDIGHGVVFLAGMDGIVRAGAPGIQTMLGQDVGASPLIVAARAAEQGTLAYRDGGGRDMIGSFRRLSRYGLVLAVALDRDDVLAEFREGRQRYLAGGIALTVLLLLVGWLLIRHKQRLLRTRAELLLSQSVLTDTLENMTQGIIMVDADRRIPVINRRAIELLGLPPAMMADDPGFDDVVSWLAAHGEFGEAAHGKAEAGRLAELERLQQDVAVYERTRPNGVILEVRTRSLGDRRAVRTLTDVTERRVAEARASYLAQHDALTGLANRSRFRSRLDEAIRNAEQGSRHCIVLLLDLDRFKLVNDIWGDGSGDRVLGMVAERLRAAVDGIDIAARLGGDEFAVLQTAIERPEEGARLAQRLIDAVSQPYDLDGLLLTIGVSIGVAVYPADGGEAEQLLKSADMALQAAKEKGSGQYRYFHREMDRRVQEKAEFEQDLREVIAADGLQVAYQPICDADTGQPIGYEALARWHHPRRGNVSPGVFIPAAEEAGLISALGYGILRTACRTAAGWPGDIYVTVNFSAMQLFDAGFEHIVLGVLRDTGLPPHRLGVEITEGVLIREGEAVPAALRLLQRHGVRILLDDFGTGHAGLSYLVRFPFDCIKLDRSFVARVVEDIAAQAVIRAALVLSESLQLDVVGEGVETVEQLDALRRMGCLHIQGFLFGAPMPASKLPWAATTAA